MVKLRTWILFWLVAWIGDLAQGQVAPQSAAELFSKASMAIAQQEWQLAHELATQTLAALEPSIDDATLDGNGVYARELWIRSRWAQARALHGQYQLQDALANIDAALPPTLAWMEAAERLDDPDLTWHKLLRQSAGLLLSLRAALLVEAGLTDLAAESSRRACNLVNEVVRDGPQRDYGTFFDCNLGEVRRLMALGSYDAALNALDQTLGRFSWENAQRKMRADKYAQRRAQFEVFRGMVLAGRSEQAPEDRASALLAFQRAIESESIDSQDFVTAALGSAELALQSGDLELAQRNLTDLQQAFDEAQLQLANEDELWRAELQCRVARATNPDDAAPRARLAEDFRVMLAQWRAVERDGGVSFWRFDRPRNALVALLDGASDNERLELLVDAGEFGVLWRALGAPQPSAAEVRSELCKDGNACLVYVSGVERGWLIAFDDERVISAPIAGSRAIERSVRDLRTALDLTALDAKIRAQRVATSAHALADLLLPEQVRAALAKWKHLRVVGRDLISSAPLWSLPIEGERPLSATHALSDLPSLACGWALSKRRSAREHDRSRLTVIGAPAPSADVVQEFPHVFADSLDTRLLAALGQGIDKDRLVVLAREKATVSAVSACAASCDVLQILAHGVLFLRHELRTIVVLSPDEMASDGLLTIALVRGWRAPDVVILSVCRAGAGIQRTGDVGASDLGGAFLMAGASSVLLTDGELSVKDAVELTRDLPRRLREQSSVAQALRDAYAELHAKSPERALRGPLQVFGLGE